MRSVPSKWRPNSCQDSRFMLSGAMHMPMRSEIYAETSTRSLSSGPFPRPTRKPLPDTISTVKSSWLAMISKHYSTLAPSGYGIISSTTTIPKKHKPSSNHQWCATLPKASTTANSCHHSAHSNGSIMTHNLTITLLKMLRISPSNNIKKSSHRLSHSE